MKDLENIYGVPKRINDSTHRINFICGTYIVDAIADAISVARDLDTLIQFEFSDMTVSVHSDSDHKLIYRDWCRALRGYIGRSVGPNPNPVLTMEEKARDARIESENEHGRQKCKEEYRQKFHVEYEAKAKIHRGAVEAKLANASDIELIDKAGWQKFKDLNSGGYGGAVVTYSERLARLIQVEMANGKKLEDVAEAAFGEADFGDFAQFIRRDAVLTLAARARWKYGNQLRRWYNLKTQLSNEGEKANESGVS